MNVKTLRGRTTCLAAIGALLIGAGGFSRSSAGATVQLDEISGTLAGNGAKTGAGTNKTTYKNGNNTVTLAFTPTAAPVPPLFVTETTAAQAIFGIFKVKASGEANVGISDIFRLSFDAGFGMVQTTGQITGSIKGGGNAAGKKLTMQLDDVVIPWEGLSTIRVQFDPITQLSSRNSLAQLTGTLTYEPAVFVPAAEVPSSGPIVALPAAVAIPLPPAATSGVAMLALMSVIMMWRKAAN